ncbi:MAG: cytochrome c [Acetobacteraceae bacterium]|nr:cytochrome c [Acetobacteraceae bacterium]
MSPLRFVYSFLLVLVTLARGASVRADPQPIALPDLGQAITEGDLAGYFAIPPSGAGLPPGGGTPAQGELAYANHCAACHGDKMQGMPALGAPALTGGRGSLATGKPIKTVESYWPYPTTLFDYIKRAMPFDAPGSLTNDEVYAVTAYILASGRVIESSELIDASTLPKVAMPNRDGFIPDPRQH